eukprot:SAG22_NODE_16856_length_316_cov_0.783410_1_plen_79_part_01
MDKPRPGTCAVSGICPQNLTLHCGGAVEPRVSPLKFDDGAPRAARNRLGQARDWWPAPPAIHFTPADMRRLPPHDIAGV